MAGVVPPHGGPTRNEHDFLGARDVPDAALYGVQPDNLVVTRGAGTMEDGAAVQASARESKS